MGEIIQPNDINSYLNQDGLTRIFHEFRGFHGGYTTIYHISPKANPSKYRSCTSCPEDIIKPALFMHYIFDHEGNHYISLQCEEHAHPHYHELWLNRGE